MTAALRARFSEAGISYFIPTVLFCIAIGGALLLIDADRREQIVAAERLNASKQLADIAARLDAKINANVNLVQGLVTVMGVSPVDSQADFSPLAESIFSRPSELKVLAAAPDLVVRMVYPESPNRKAIGLDYRKNPQQRDAALQAMRTRQLVLTGPVNLVQGGTGLIARYPVILHEDKSFWGILSAVIDLDRLYADSGLIGASSLNVALYRQDAAGKKAVFYGDEATLAAEPVETVLPVGIETWHLAAIPGKGWGHDTSELSRFRAYMVLIAIAIVIPIFWAALLTKQRQANMQVLRRNEEQLDILSQRLGLALKASEIGVWEYLPGSGTLIWDGKMRELYGVDPAKPICDYSDWLTALHPDDVAEAERAFRICIEREVPYNTEFRVIDRAGNIRHIRAHGGVYRHPSGEVRMVGANWDITRNVTMQTALRDARDQLEHQSLHDALTGLANRRYLERHLRAGEANGEDQRIALVHADLDRFKEVNDTFGHRTGDGVLKAVAERIRGLVGKGEFASRIGGDEFVIVTHGENAEERARTIGAAIVEVLAEPIDFEGHLCRIGCSAGVAVQTYRHENPLQLLGNADIALYEAKKRGRGRVEFFSDGLRHAAVLAKKTADELVQGLERDEFVPFFQPQFDAETLDIVGAEALARWNHEKLGILTPDRFLAIAGESNRVSDIDRIIFEKALFHLARWQANGVNIPAVSVNISAQRLADDKLFESLGKLAIKPGSVSFELLETIYLDDPDDSLIDAVHRLKAAGIDIEIDDFGSGHASIVSLLELAPKRLKIDRKLVAPIRESLSRRQLVASIIEIGRSQGIEIVAEGVETMEHAAILRDLGCHALQGYAFAKPMSANAMMDFYHEWQLRKVQLPAVG